MIAIAGLAYVSDQAVPEKSETDDEYATVAEQLATALELGVSSPDAIKGFARSVLARTTGSDLATATLLRSLRSNAVRPAGDEEAPERRIADATPSVARWADIGFRRVDVERVEVRTPSGVRVLTFRELDLIDGRTKGPDAQWDTLLTVIDMRGQITWEKSGASKKLPHRLRRLSKQLQKFFSLADEPFVYSEDIKGWTSAFTIGADSALPMAPSAKPS